MPQPARKPRLTAEDWENAAWDAFVEGGLDAVAVEPVAVRLGSTKGSFYWHFPDRAALVGAVLRRWQERTEQIIADLGDIPGPGDRLTSLFAAVFTDPQWARVEVDLLSNADQPAVGHMVAQVSARRVEFMATALSESGLEPDAAADGALQAYALWTGLLELTVAAPILVPHGAARERFLDRTCALLLSLLPQSPADPH